MKPTPLLTGGRKHLTDGFPEPQCPVADGQDRGGHPTPATRAQQIGPRLGGLSIPVSEGDELLATIGTDPDHHQQAQFLLLEADLEVDPVDPHIDVVGARQIALTEGFGLILPLCSEPGDRRCREPCTRPEELLQRRTEVPAGQTM